VEVQEKAKTMAGELEVREKLSFMYGMKGKNGLDLNDHSLFDQQVDSVALIQSDTLVHEWQRNLSSDREAALAKLARQTGLVRTFKQAWAEHCVNLDRRVHNFATNLV